LIIIEDLGEHLVARFLNSGTLSSLSSVLGSLSSTLGSLGGTSSLGSGKGAGSVIVRIVLGSSSISA